MIAENASVSTAGPVILDNTFPDYDSGLRLPQTVLTAPGHFPMARSGANTLQVVAPALQIMNLDRRPPPGYRPGGVPRDPAFNANVFGITATPSMPRIVVQCGVRGFSPAQTPIYWRLQCRHVLARHINIGGSRYSGRSEIHRDEWQGRSTTQNFTLFGNTPDPAVTFDYNNAASVMGGHALLTVAARPPGAAGWLLDYVHLRIGGTNPRQNQVVAHLEHALDGRDENILTMMRAVFAHESNYTQFRLGAQTGTSRDKVPFNWPDDPPGFPLASFDFGIGISQYTKIPGQVINGEKMPDRVISRGVAWDWRENIRSDLNLFLTGNLRGNYSPGYTWRQWARVAWARHNGGGGDAEAYARRMAESPIGRQVSDTRVPTRASMLAQTTGIPGPARRPAPPAWPPR